MKTHRISTLSTNSTINCYHYLDLFYNFLLSIFNKLQIFLFSLLFDSSNKISTPLPHSDPVKNYSYLPQDTHTSSQEPGHPSTGHTPFYRNFTPLYTPQDLDTPSTSLPLDTHPSTPHSTLTPLTTPLLHLSHWTHTKDTPEARPVPETRDLTIGPGTRILVLFVSIMYTLQHATVTTHLGPHCI